MAQLVKMSTAKPEDLYQRNPHGGKIELTSKLTSDLCMLAFPCSSISAHTHETLSKWLFV